LGITLVQERGRIATLHGFSKPATYQNSKREKKKKKKSEEIKLTKQLLDLCFGGNKGGGLEKGLIAHKWAGQERSSREGKKSRKRRKSLSYVNGKGFSNGGSDPREGKEGWAQEE